MKTYSTMLEVSDVEEDPITISVHSYSAGELVLHIEQPKYSRVTFLRLSDREREALIAALAGPTPAEEPPPHG